ncbi:MAG TPA: hypothetical protein VK501_19740 [Baekduia sp.]|uniref:hypothetical protein n=1 Tax=Baekduia sp. TaxID=2600305 RepID=UPI002CF62EA5|nr:hypothetical protein [Baekduia sp.]HMJ36145.1 hypothetical protein [Baekduia sp.]
MDPSQVRRPLIAAVAALALASACAAPAHADPADLSFSTLSCAAVDGSTRPGDLVQCTLVARVLGPANANAVTADVSIPTATAFDPLPYAQGVPDDPLHPTSIHFGTVVLGLMNPSFSKPATVRLRVAADADPGASIQPVARIRNGVEPDTILTAAALTVMPQPADLGASTTACADAGAPPLRAGDTLECTFRLANAPGREDAVGVTVTAPIPRGTTWTAGGNETAHSATGVTWSAAALPDGVKSGATAGALRFRVTVDPALPGGTTLFVNATASWQNALSESYGSVGLGAPAITVAPGPAVLSASALGCVDLDGAPLLAGDSLFCTLNVVAAAGHEDVTDVHASAGVPAGAAAGSPTDASGTRMPFDPGSFATIVAGSAKSVAYKLTVAADAVAGTMVVPTAQVSGRSVPSDVTVSQALVAGPYVVGVRAPAAARPDTVAASVAATVAAAAAAPPTASLICASRRVVVVNVRPPRSRRWKSVTFSFAKKTVKGKKVASTGAFRARLVFQGLPKGALKVSIKGVTTKGTTVRSARTYNLCAKKT